MIPNLRMQSPSYLSEVVASVAASTEKAITEQLNELISRGLLIVKVQGPSLVQDSDGVVKVAQSVRLCLKDQEYIEKIEKEVRELRARIEMIQNAVDGPVEE